MNFDNEGSRRGRRIQSDVVGRRTFRRSEPYRPYPHDRNGYGPRSSRPVELCNNCKRTGHYARECPNASVCNNCGVSGHIASKCPKEQLCRNCKKPGHLAADCRNEPVCNMCGKTGHLAKECSAHELGLPKSALCKKCYLPGHIMADCPNDKACNNCRQTGHLARDCVNSPVCNGCGEPGHLVRDCPRVQSPPRIMPPRGGFGGGFGGGFDDFKIIICRVCGGRGHLSVDCPSDPLFMRGGFRRWELLDCVQIGDVIRWSLVSVFGSSHGLNFLASLYYCGLNFQNLYYYWQWIALLLSVQVYDESVSKCQESKQF